MIHPLLYLAFTLLFLLLETTLLAWSLPSFLRPDLVLILVIYLGLNERIGRGGMLAWVCGVCKDVFTGYFLGLYGFVYLVSFLGTRGAVRWFNSENPLLLVIMVFWGSLAKGLLLAFALGFFAAAGGVWPLVLELLLPQVIASTLAALLLLALLHWLQARLGRRFRVPGLKRLNDGHGF